jgi:two-component system, OmpR family, phosphate regulon sensor histidine kinase PhoR
VLLNLIKNANKFSPHKSTISVVVRISDDDPSVLKTEVVDVGVGIAKEDIPKLFKRFGKLD